MKTVPKVIVDLGSNWKTPDDLFAAIHLAKACGAHAIKYQMCTTQDLYGPSYVLPNRRDMHQYIPQLAEKAAATGIEFMCTAFSAEGVRFLNPYVRAHKIASSDCTDPEILDAARVSDKPTYISTGGHTRPDLDQTVKHFGIRNLTLLYCVSEYPARVVDLTKVRQYRERYAVPVGFSDHTAGITVSHAAVTHYGVEVLEKHFNPFDYPDTPDAPHSISCDELKTLVKWIEGMPPPIAEQDMRLMHNRRLIATQDIEQGEVLQRGINYGSYRSLEPDYDGLPPMAWQALEGKVANTLIRCGQGLSAKVVIPTPVEWNEETGDPP